MQRTHWSQQRPAAAHASPVAAVVFNASRGNALPLQLREHVRHSLLQHAQL
jgi:hypothetical protein